MLHTLKNNKSLTFYQPTTVASRNTFSTSYAGGIAATPVAQTGLIARTYTSNVHQAFANLQESVLRRGMQYVNNRAASKGGFMAENFVADSYNLDAVIKGESENTWAYVPESHNAASPDVVVLSKRGNTIQEASLKYYGDAASSAKTQTNPKYGDQVRIIPSDQLEEGKSALAQLHDKNTIKGRLDAAKIQQDTLEKLTDRIRTKNGVSSTPLTKEQSIKLANSTKQVDAAVVVDRKKFNEVMDETGITKKTKDAIFRKELHGLGMAAAIGLGIGFTIGFAVTLAQSGVSPDGMKAAMVAGAKGGIESGALSIIGYGLGRTIGETAVAATTGVLQNLGIQMTENLSKICQMGTMGTMMIAVFSVYQFAKLKIKGVSTRDALRQVATQALFSLSVLALSLAVQSLFGGVADIIVSVGVGVVCILYSFGENLHQREISEKIQQLLIEKCKPIIA